MVLDSRFLDWNLWDGLSPCLHVHMKIPLRSHFRPLPPLPLTAIEQLSLEGAGFGFGLGTGTENHVMAI